MMTDDFQSISKGVFVVPYRAPSEEPYADVDPEPEAGPSRPLKRPLKEWYDRAYEAFSTAREAFESQRTEEQLEDIADWLEGCSAPRRGGLQFGFETKRLHVGVMQDTSPRLPELLGTVVKHRVVLQGREVVDLSSGVRSVAMGLMDDGATWSRSGRSGMDEVERWFFALPTAQQTPILIHIQDAQQVPSLVLSELVYVFSLRTALPIRVLLSVPSISTFMASFSHIEPSGVEVEVLGLGAKRASGGGVAAVLEAGKDSPKSQVRLGQEVAGEIMDEEKMFGGGAASALKSLRWRLLHHGANSPLSTLISGEPDMMSAKVEAILRGESDGAVLGDLLEIGATREARATLNPAPRVSVLHALSSSTAYSDRLTKPPMKERPAEPMSVEDQTSTPRSSKRRRTNRTILSPADDSDSAPAAPAPATIEATVAKADSSDPRGDLKELEVLFNLWRSAGRNVNLWDWLEGFRGSIMGQGADGDHDREGADEGKDQAEAGSSAMEVDDGTEEPDAAGAQPEKPRSELEDEAAEEERAARLHAVFVRFCEEARMLGLVRARGRAKRADEVVKSIVLV